MNKIDFRRDYVLMIDTETANSLEEPLVYDVGFAVIDTKGNVYETGSYVCKEIFLDHRDLMETSYYANKIPSYWVDIWTKKRTVADFLTIRKIVFRIIQKYQIKYVCAHNSLFDLKALNCSTRYITKSRFRYFFPLGIEMWDTMRMAESIILKMPSYKKFCVDNNYFTANNQMKKTAEVLYQFITKDLQFTEAHTGLADVLIEKEILVYCFRQHKKMRRELFSP